MAIRAFHESTCHDDSMFLTLTYDQEHLLSRSLFMDDIRQFNNILKKKLRSKKIIIFGCGEYGENYGRPHFHLLVFNHWFTDSIYYSKSSSGERLYTSNTLNSIWNKGNCIIGRVSFASAYYVARYSTKKVIREKSWYADYDLVPETGIFPKRPPLGRSWIEKNYKFVLDNNFVWCNDIKCPVPRYYKKWLEKYKPEEYAKYCEMIESYEFQDDSDYSRYARFENHMSRHTEIHRSLEGMLASRSDDYDKKLLSQLRGEYMRGQRKGD